jgi:Leucine-rich repeat (LRR) protein
MKVQVVYIGICCAFIFAEEPQYNYSTDSLAVRIVMDSSGCVPVLYKDGNILSREVDSVSHKRNGRITSLYIGGFLSECTTSHLRREIGRLTELETLNIQHNFLTRLPDELFSLYKLKFLDLAGSNISVLPAGIGNLRNLRYLSLALCWDLSSLPNEIGNLDSLGYLDLRFNSLKQLPSAIGNCKSLWWLRLNNNKFESLPVELGNCTELYFLEIDFNNITDLPNSIGKLVNLSDFSIFNNKLSELPKEISNLRKLNRLYLNDNQLQSLPDSIVNLNLFCTVAGNRLCNQPTLIKAWLDAHAGVDWWKSQIGCTTKVIQSRPLPKSISPSIQISSEIFDLKGRKVNNAFTFSSNPRQNLPRGVYFVRQNTGKTAGMRKIIIGQ